MRKQNLKNYKLPKKWSRGKNFFYELIWQIFFKSLISSPFPGTIWRKYILIAFFTSLTFSQSENDEEPSDSTFIIINSGDSIRINKFEADLGFQPMLKLDLEFSDFDSTKYDLTQVNKLVDSSGNIIISRKKLSTINNFQKCFNISTRLIVWYLILDRFF